MTAPSGAKPRRQPPFIFQTSPKDPVPGGTWATSDRLAGAAALNRGVASPFAVCNCQFRFFNRLGCLRSTSPRFARPSCQEGELVLLLDARFPTRFAWSRRFCCGLAVLGRHPKLRRARVPITTRRVSEGRPPTSTTAPSGAKPRRHPPFIFRTSPKKQCQVEYQMVGGTMRCSSFP